MVETTQRRRYWLTHFHRTNLHSHNSRFHQTHVLEINKTTEHFSKKATLYWELRTD
jgi:hypothetical protein